MKRRASICASAVVLLMAALSAIPVAAMPLSLRLAALAAAVQSNIVATIEAATAVRKSAVRELLITNSYKILTSTKLPAASTAFVSTTEN